MNISSADATEVDQVLGEGRRGDPFELLADDSFFEPQPRPSRVVAAATQKKSNVPVSRVNTGLGHGVSGVSGGTLVWGMVAFGLIVLLGGGVWHLWPAPEPVTAYAYCEMRAIGPEGRPVAGAIVKQGETTLGLTDSFGEWRRYMKVRLGTTLTLSIQKKLQTGKMYAIKNIAVPAFLPKSGELEIKTQIGLQRDIDAIPPPPVDRVAPKTHEAPLAQVSKEVSKEVSNDMVQPPHQGLSHAGQGEAPAVASPRPVGKIWVEERSAMAADDSLKARAVAASLRDLFNQGGFQVSPDAALVLQVGIVKNPLAQFPLYYVGGEIRTRNEPEKNKSIFSMLRGFQSDPQKSAQDIAMGVGRYGLNLNLKDQEICGEGVPCTVFKAPIATNPPFPEWRRKQLKLSAGDGPHVEVFVSGFMAKPLGNLVYEYWGPPSGAVNVTVVQGSRTIFREKLTPHPTHGAPLTIAGYEKGDGRGAPKL